MRPIIYRHCGGSSIVPVLRLWSSTDYFVAAKRKIFFDVMGAIDGNFLTMMEQADPARPLTPS
jgi:hypothetical protein